MVSLLRIVILGSIACVILAAAETPAVDLDVVHQSMGGPVVLRVRITEDASVVTAGNLQLRLQVTDVEGVDLPRRNDVESEFVQEDINDSPRDGVVEHRVYLHHHFVLDDESRLIAAITVTHVNDSGNRDIGNVESQLQLSDPGDTGFDAIISQGIRDCMTTGMSLHSLLAFADTWLHTGNEGEWSALIYAVRMWPHGEILPERVMDRLVLLGGTGERRRFLFNILSKRSHLEEVHWIPVLASSTKRLRSDDIRALFNGKSAIWLEAVHRAYGNQLSAHDAQIILEAAVARRRNKWEGRLKALVH